MSTFNVYIIGVKPNGPVKIGATSWVQVRFNNLQSGSPVKLHIIREWSFECTSCAYLERVAHRLLATWRMRGEWFSCSPKIAVECIEQIIKETKDCTNWRKYKNVVDGVKWTGHASQLGANASVEARKAKSATGIRLIKDRWPLPSSEWKTKDLLAEAGVSLNTAKAHLGKRPIAQYNHQAKLKRKANAR